jgi:hypothetical protein
MSFYFLTPAWLLAHLGMDYLLGEMDMQIRSCQGPPLFNLVDFHLNNAILKLEAVKKPRNLRGLQNT